MQCENVIYAYMGFAAFSIFFVIAGIVAIQLLQMQPVPIDLISFFFVLWNFSVRLGKSKRLLHAHSNQNCNVEGFL